MSTHIFMGKVKKSSAAIVPNDSIREGYDFIGWNKEVPSTMPAEDLIINVN